MLSIASFVKTVLMIGPDAGVEKIPDSLTKLLAVNLCDCRRPYRVIRCDWPDANYDYAVACPSCDEFVAEGNTLAELEDDFREHLKTGDVPF